MSLSFIKEGTPIALPQAAKLLDEYCRQEKLDITFEWKEGQYWLHSDLPGERPIGVVLDRELERHLDYFKKSSLHKEILARAIGIKGSHRPEVLDLTGGLLGDTLLFLSMGCQVTTLERHPVIAFLLLSAWENARHPLLKNLKLIPIEAQDYLSHHSIPEVVYFDPMFEDINEKSRPRKEMRIFRELIGQDTDARGIFQMAQEQRPKRLVVKRPRHSATLSETKPLQFIGKATRYDVYFGQNHGPNESNPLK